MDYSGIISKLKDQESPEMLLTDVDGTLFSPNFNILTAPFFNTQTAFYMKTHVIGFAIVTGRSFWRRIDQYHLKLLGLPQPDIAITANGTAIYFLSKGKYISDFVWQGIMQSTKVTDINGTVMSWNKWEISQTIQSFLTENGYRHQFGRGNTYLIRVRFNNYPIEKIELARKGILSLFPKGIRIILTEKLLWKNTTEVFSGEMLITPSTAGKDKAVQYVLLKLSENIQKSIRGYIFGDATVDVPMLVMKESENNFSLSQYGVHPTPLAKEILEEKKKSNNNIHLLYGDGPREILWTLRPELRKYTDTAAEMEKVVDQLSPAQNNKARQTIRLFEGVLDKIIDKNLSPNEISFLGLKRLSEGLTLLHKPKNSFIEKTKGWYAYAFGNLTDILDGIRARNSDKKEENGQLVDGFSDRAKEFLQLYQRGKKRLAVSEQLSLTTFLTALSCALPSIARAQVEIGGKTVTERDEKGGSMIDRTKRLFLSLLFDNLGVTDYSEAKDNEIFTTNIATFQNRVAQTKKFDEKKIKYGLLSDFQKKALERFLLYVDVLQQENEIVENFLIKYPKLLKEYRKESVKLAKDYLQLPISKLRKKLVIKDYNLKVKKYL